MDSCAYMHLAGTGDDKETRYVTNYYVPYNHQELGSTNLKVLRNLLRILQIL